MTYICTYFSKITAEFLSIHTFAFRPFRATSFVQSRTKVLVAVSKTKIFKKKKKNRPLHLSENRKDDRKHGNFARRPPVCHDEHKVENNKPDRRGYRSKARIVRPLVPRVNGTRPIARRKLPACSVSN